VLNHELGVSMHRSYPLTPATNLEKKPTNSIQGIFDDDDPV
jgi:hypothetical protein